VSVENRSTMAIWKSGKGIKYTLSNELKGFNSSKMSKILIKFKSSEKGFSYNIP
jgi:hypothetical protein